MAVVESFTLPERERNVILDLERRYPNIKPSLKKSEAVRVGLKAFSNMTEHEVNKILIEQIGRLAVGRPKAIQKEEGDGFEPDAKLQVNDAQWRKLEQFLGPHPATAGRPRADTRKVLNGIIHIFMKPVQNRTKIQGLPSYATCHRKLKEWTVSGQWKDICLILIENANEAQRAQLAEVLLRVFTR